LSTRRKRPRSDDPAASDGSRSGPTWRRVEGLPERTDILALLERRAAPLAFEALAGDLGVEGVDALDALNRRLRAMTRDGQLVHNRRGEFGLLSRMDLVSGRVQAHRDGYGFLVPDERGEDLFLSPREMRGLMDGDRVVVRTVRIDRQGRREGAVVEVLERATRRVVGRYLTEHGVGHVRPENRRIHHDVMIPAADAGGASHGQIVAAEIVEPPGRHTQPIGRVTEVLGEHMAPGMEIDVAVRAYDLPEEWPEVALAEAGALGTSVPEGAKAGRVDLRALPLVTIDGADARDFDDAVHCRATPRGWKLTVAIADVGAYVEPDGALDAEACLRGTSVYFPQRVIPMLPEALSNGLCSLVPDEERLCMACELLVDRDGRVTRSRFFAGLMRSHARLTYDEVAALVVECDAKSRRARGALVGHLDELYRLFRALAGARRRRGAMDFDTVEPEFEFDEERKIRAVRARARNDAHRVIEECMIAANVAAAKLLERHRMPTLYRVHEGPDEDGLGELRVFLGELGLRLGGGPRPEPRHYAALIERTASRPDAYLIQTVLLRSLTRAIYTPVNAGHFGLAHQAYAHFTSPIRRYPDLMVHRAIKHVLGAGRRDSFGYDVARMHALGDHASMTERRADEATRDAVSWLKCEFMMDRIGEVFAGTVSGVTAFGVFVTLDDIFVEGLVHVSVLGHDYFHFDPVHHRLEGERTRTVHRLGDRLRVRVMRVDLDERKIDFELADAPGPPPAGTRRARGPRRARRRGAR
jgi:ribonuclease R